MGNFVDYLFWRGDLSFDAVQFGAVDALILSWFVTMPLSLPLPETVSLAAEEMLPGAEGRNREYLRLMAGSRRFGGLGLERFTEKFDAAEQLQFAAVTFRFADGGSFVAFRGTDSSIVGWKENFNMAFSDEVPAQREAAEYIRGTRGRIMLGGHSKGGNLAVYAAVRSGTKVDRVYNFDGPGLSESVADSPEYRFVEPKIDTYLPEMSLVGILLEHTGRYYTVRSDGRGLMQHDPYTWQVTPAGFELADGLSPASMFADRMIRSWLASLTNAERENFVETLYNIVEAADADTVGELAANRWKSAEAMLNAYAGLDLRTRARLMAAVGKLVRSAVRSAG